MGGAWAERLDGGLARFPVVIGRIAPKSHPQSQTLPRQESSSISLTPTTTQSGRQSLRLRSPGCQLNVPSVRVRQEIDAADRVPYAPTIATNLLPSHGC